MTSARSSGGQVDPERGRPSRNGHLSPGLPKDLDQHGLLAVRCEVLEIVLEEDETHDILECLNIWVVPEIVFPQQRSNATDRRLVIAHGPKDFGGRIRVKHAKRFSPQTVARSPGRELAAWDRPAPDVLAPCRETNRFRCRGREALEAVGHPDRIHQGLRLGDSVDDESVGVFRVGAVEPLERFLVS